MRQYGVHGRSPQPLRSSTRTITAVLLGREAFQGLSQGLEEARLGRLQAAPTDRPTETRSRAMAYSRTNEKLVRKLAPRHLPRARPLLRSPLSHPHGSIRRRDNSSRMEEGGHNNKPKPRFPVPFSPTSSTQTGSPEPLRRHRHGLRATSNKSSRPPLQGRPLLIMPTLAKEVQERASSSNRRRRAKVGPYLDGETSAATKIPSRSQIENQLRVPAAPLRSPNGVPSAAVSRL